MMMNGFDEQTDNIQFNKVTHIIINIMMTNQ